MDETYTLMKQQSALNDLWRTYCIHAYKAGEHQLNMLCLTWKKNGEHGGIIWCTEIHYKDIFSSLQSPHLYWWIISHVWWNRTAFRWSCLINSHPLILGFTMGKTGKRELCSGDVRLNILIALLYCCTGQGVFLYFDNVLKRRCWHDSRPSVLTSCRLETRSNHCQCCALAHVKLCS